MTSELQSTEFNYEISTLPSGNNPSKVIKDIFPYGGRPSDKVTSSDKYHTSILNDFIDQNNEERDYDSGCEIIDVEKIKTQLNTIVDGRIRTIYAVVTYPLTTEAIIKFECNKPVTFGMLLFLFTNAYQITYAIEESDDRDPGLMPGMFNRAKSNGRFGIWGHVIGDLCYNGGSEIQIYDNYIVCNFGCDS